MVGSRRPSRSSGNWTKQGPPARLLTLDPGFTINRWCSAVGFAPNLKGIIADGLKLAGLPE